MIDLVDLEIPAELDPTEHRAFVKRLKKDLEKSASKMSRSEARHSVKLYYQLQEFRKASKNQARSSGEADEPNALISWIGEEFAALEKVVQGAMDAYSDEFVVGRWSKSLTGVGPIISAGLLAHIDITKAKTAGGIWRFAGLDPTVTWNKGERRPWNADLKVLLWKFADCQIRAKGFKNSFYGPLYEQYKANLIVRNGKLEYKDAAAAGAARVGKTTEAYKFYVRGMLPPGHIDMRARRWIEKLFISHWHHVAYIEHFQTDPPVPYIFAHRGDQHVHRIDPPNWPMSDEYNKKEKKSKKNKEVDIIIEE